MTISPCRSDMFNEARGWRADDLTPDDLVGVQARFWSKVDRSRPDECWLWTASTKAGGYGQFSVWPKVLLAHRVAYVLLTGRSLTAQLTLDHLCSRPACCNPAHLEPVSLNVNSMRQHGGDDDIETCAHGHRDVYRDPSGRRRCRTCRKEQRQNPAPPVESRHWYVDATDAPGYCAACGTPEHNRRRHTPRRAA